MLTSRHPSRKEPQPSLGEWQARNSAGPSRTTVVAALTLSAGALLAVAWILVRPLGWDEVEFFRATRWVREGLLPYVDFWEHHSPLQWLLFAPLSSLGGDTGGARDVLALRWAQLPLWVVALAAWVGLAPAGEPRRLLAALAGLLVLSPGFLLFAVEYRVDSLASALLLLGLVAGTKAGSGAVAGGVLLALVPMANLRLGPQAALAVVLLALVDVERARWGLTGRSWRLLAGAAITTAAAGAALAATGSLVPAWQQLVVDNGLVARISGARFRTFWDVLGTVLLEADPVPLLLLGSGLAAAAAALRSWRRPDRSFVLGVLFLAGLASVYGLNIHYPYHFQASLLLALPVLAERLSAAPVAAGRRAAPVVLLLGLWCAGVHVRGLAEVRDERPLACQDGVMRAVDRHTSPGETVWDGGGLALRRKPAYRYWFLPLHVRLLARAGRYEPLTASQLAAAPPAAFVNNARTVQWLLEWPGLAAFFEANYAPVGPHLWLPAPNGVLRREGETLSWSVLRTGAYRLLAAPRLAAHPHFAMPGFSVLAGRLGLPAEASLDTTAFAPGAARLEVRRNGVPVAREGWGEMRLEKGDRLEVQSGETGALGVFFAPRDVPRLFSPAPGRAGLDPPLIDYF